MDPAFRADFNPLDLIWWTIGSLGFAALLIALLLVAYVLLYPIAANLADQDNKPDPFFDRGPDDRSGPRSTNKR